MRKNHDIIKNWQNQALNKYSGATSTCQWHKLIIFYSMLHTWYYNIVYYTFDNWIKSYFLTKDLTQTELFTLQLVRYHYLTQNVTQADLLISKESLSTMTTECSVSKQTMKHWCIYLVCFRACSPLNDFHGGGNKANHARQVHCVACNYRLTEN